MNGKTPVRRCPFEFKDRTLDQVRTTATEVESMSRVEGTLWHVGNITVSVIVCGDVRIGWKGQVYRCASQFPDDLAEAIRTGSFYVGQDEDEENFIGNNNWYEVRVWRDKTLLEEDVADIDISGMSDDDARGFILDCAADYTD